MRGKHYAQRNQFVVCVCVPGNHKYSDYVPLFVFVEVFQANVKCYTYIQVVNGILF